MHLSDDGLVSKEELIHMAIKLQEDLIYLRRQARRSSRLRGVDEVLPTR